jgi:uncharacterized membrane protein YtjA (UPF0391 family)
MPLPEVEWIHARPRLEDFAIYRNPRPHRTRRSPGSRDTESGTPLHPNKKPDHMPSWAVTFLIIALIAAVLGFGEIAGTAVVIAKIIFFVFLILFVVSVIIGRRSPPVG